MKRGKGRNRKSVKRVMKWIEEGTTGLLAGVFFPIVVRMHSDMITIVVIVIAGRTWKKKKNDDIIMDETLSVFVVFRRWDFLLLDKVSVSTLSPHEPHPLLIALLFEKLCPQAEQKYSRNNDSSSSSNTNPPFLP